MTRILAIVPLLYLAACTPAAPAPGPTVTVTSTVTSTPGPTEPDASGDATITEGQPCELDATELSAGEIETIRQGLKSKSNVNLVDRGVRLPLGEYADLGYTRAVVVDVEGDAVLLVADSSLDKILAVDDIARELFTWDEAAQPAGQIGRFRDTIKSSNFPDAAYACLNN